ncbi:tumor necrosis factor receptor superfamily member 1B isoform X4 [Pan troglodytes]|uniref:tumor necrosis factor receptor superfamily member 1B isoform X4 n=1 Tax=Pan troglodytes TaxID=9598 RepID=UPI003013D5AA
MAPVAVWAALAVGLELWAAAHALPAQVAFTPYAPEPGSTCRFREYYDQTAQMCCSKCPPGQHAKVFCTKTSDTVCDSCEDSTYTQLWNWVPECLSCGSRCSSDQVETQACTREQNRICTCRPGWYCALSKQEGCRLCAPLRKCRPGFGVARPAVTWWPSLGMQAWMQSARPRPPPGVWPQGQYTYPSQCPHDPNTRSQLQNPALLQAPPSCSQWAPAPQLKGALATSLFQLPHLPADKARGTQGPEQQHLLITAPSSSSSSLESSASALDRRAPTRNQPQAPGVEASGAGEARASTGSSGLSDCMYRHCLLLSPTPGCGTPDSSPGGHGTQVNVTCIVNVCSSSDHSSQCSSQASSTMGDTDSSPSESPKDEQVPFSKEECAFRSQLETPETLLGSTEEKPLPLGVPDAGMKPS